MSTQFSELSTPLKYFEGVEDDCRALCSRDDPAFIATSAEPLLSRISIQSRDILSYGRTLPITRLIPTGECRYGRTGAAARFACHTSVQGGIGMSKYILLAVLTLTTVAAGCARVVVQKDPGPQDKGVRFYRPKPYLFIGPAEEKPADTSGERNCPKDTPSTRKVSIELRYLPDYSEEYSIRMTPGINASTTFDPKFSNGWMLTGFSSTTDQQVDDLINAIAGAVSGSIPKGAGSRVGTAQDVDAKSNVPLGFYEAVIASDHCGRKHLVGWRYVGFYPYSPCPMSGCAEMQPAACDPYSVWQLVWDGDGLKFVRMMLNEHGLIRRLPSI